MFEQVDVWSTVPNVVQRKQQESKTMTWKNTHQTKNGNARTHGRTKQRMNAKHIQKSGRIDIHIRISIKTTVEQKYSVRKRTW